MGKFLEEEKLYQIEFKEKSEHFSEAARLDGFYRGKPRPFCLPRERARENLFVEIRDGAMDYFERKRINWHDGRGEMPSNHLCSSQVQCVNFLYPFADKPEALRRLLSSVFSGIESVEPMEAEGGFVSFEWIGLCNYLKEKIRRGGRRTRGANFTSADAAVMVTLSDGRRQIILIEWKYTESYGSTWLGTAKSGTSRMEIYQWLYDDADCPLDKSRVADFCHFFYEPFYQLLRQQLLAHKMEEARELESDLVTVLHVAPTGNGDFLRVTSPGLRELGDSSIGVWKGLVKQPERFVSVSTEKLFGDFPVDAHPELASWSQYIHQRYSWLRHRDVG